MIMGRYTDIEIYPNSDNPDDGMKIDWWDTQTNLGYSFAGFIETQVTPDVVDIEDIHGNYIGRIAYVDSEEEYKEQLVELINLFVEQ